MSQSKDNFKRGTAELLILHLLQKEDLYGYQITQLFNEKSKGEYTVLEGSLYPVLFRLVDAGYLSEYEQLVGVKRKRRYYHLEEAGKVYYRELLEEFDGIIYAINSILDRTIGYSQNYA
ncbi:MAG: PadR family transcriptional regulator [Clostridia bacterium]|nr:PadR family transcriptional regulator [Clostridia bacterium]MBQ3497648.1 PadR family transcriptional regulator [Clostridia bacterium]